MDARAYLTRQGWRGSGHSLDKHNRGISKPLLIAHKRDTLGLGQKKAAHKTDDQWWMRAFDESLKNIGTGQESTLSQVRKQGVNRGGLYGFFVRGEGLAGTITSTEASSAAESSSSTPTSSRDSTPPTSIDGVAETAPSKKRKRNDDATKEQRKQEKADKKARVDCKTDKKMKRSKPASSIANTITPEEEAAVFARIEKLIRKAIRVAEKAGAYGPLLAEGDAAAHPSKPGETLDYKTAIVFREKNKRVAQKKMHKEMIVDAILAGELPNPENYTREEALANLGTFLKLKEAKDQARAKSKVSKKGSAEHVAGSSKGIAKKLAKLSKEEKAQYEIRAQAKGQTLEEYVLRRIQKKEEKSHIQEEIAEGAAVVQAEVIEASTSPAPLQKPSKSKAKSKSKDATKTEKKEKKIKKHK